MPKTPALDGHTENACLGWHIRHALSTESESFAITRLQFLHHRDPAVIDRIIGKTALL